jgi:putative sigma-54 modulation protein
MQTPLEISFHGIDKSEAVEARVREKFSRLERHFDRITHARVAIEATRKRSALPTFFHVKIEIGIPGHNPVIVNHEPADGDTQADVMLVLKDAFAAAQRQLDHVVERMDKPARREQTRRRPRQDGDAEA